MNRREKQVLTALKTRTAQNAVKAVLPAFQRLVRLRATSREGVVTCILCGSTARYNARKSAGEKGMDAGHFHDATHHGTAFDHRNCHPCCVACNRNKKGNHADYHRWMLLFYGEEVLADLRAIVRSGARFGREHFEQLAKMKVGFLDQIKIELHRIEAGVAPAFDLPTLKQMEENN